jgi:hypothetical protein
MRADARRVRAIRHHRAGEPLVERVDDDRVVMVRDGAVASEHVRDTGGRGASAQPIRMHQTAPDLSTVPWVGRSPFLPNARGDALARLRRTSLPDRCAQTEASAASVEVSGRRFGAIDVRERSDGRNGAGSWSASRAFVRKPSASAPTARRWRSMGRKSRQDPIRRLTGSPLVASIQGRGVEQRQLVGLITRRSAVRIRPPQPRPHTPEPRVRPPGVRLCPVIPSGTSLLPRRPRRRPRRRAGRAG